MIRGYVEAATTSPDPRVNHAQTVLVQVIPHMCTR